MTPSKLVWMNKRTVNNVNKILVLVIILALSTVGSSQNRDSVPSLSSVYLQKNSIEKVDLLNEFALKTYNTYADSTLKVVNDAKLIAKEIKYIGGEANSLYIIGLVKIISGQNDSSITNLNEANRLFASILDKKGQSKCLNAIGVAYVNQDKYELGLSAYKKSLEINRLINDTGNIGTNLFNIANIHYKKGDYENAMINYEKVLLIKQQLNDKNGESQCLNNLGNLFEVMGDYPNALEYYNKSLIIEEANNNEIGIANRLNNISVIYKKRGQLEKSLDYLKNSISIYEKYNQTYNLALATSNIGNIYNLQENLEEAEKVYKKSLALSESIDFHTQISTALNNLGTLEVKKEKYNTALDYFRRALIINQKYENKNGTCLNYIGLANAYSKLNLTQKALENALKAEEMASELQFIDIQSKAYKILSEIYYNKKNYKKGFDHLLAHKKLDDSIFSTETIQQITEVEFEYKYKKTIDSASTREQGLNKKVKIARQNIEDSERLTSLLVVAGLSIILLLGVIILTLRLKNINSLKHNILVEQKLLRSQMTPHFIFNSLSVLQGIILNREYEKSINYLSRFSKLLRITLENSRDKMVLLNKEIEAIKNYLILQNLRTEIPYIYTINIDDTINTEQVLIPPMMIQPFIENAIEHAFQGKLSPEIEQKIDLTIILSRKELICTIIDNGIGIHSTHKKTSTKKSLATTITRDRLKVLAKEFNVNANLQIIDRKDNDEEGTIIVLTLPYKII